MVKGDLTIEKILEEKRIFDMSLNFEKLGVGDADKEWSLPGMVVSGRLASIYSQFNFLSCSLISI